jgi:1-pyrroline-5-carboxylate dehydrogenase
MERDLPFEVPCIVNGILVSSTSVSIVSDSSQTHRIQVKTGNIAKQIIPSDHARHLCFYHEADQATVAAAIDGALAAKQEWESMPWNDRAAIFLKAADLISGKYRYRLMAATMLGQGKNAWQAEIDAAAEVSAFSGRWGS